METPENLIAIGLTVDDAKRLARQQYQKHETQRRIRAEVEAMDWPDIIGE